MANEEDLGPTLVQLLLCLVFPIFVDVCLYKHPSECYVILDQSDDYILTARMPNIFDRCPNATETKFKFLNMYYFPQSSRECLVNYYGNLQKICKKATRETPQKQQLMKWTLVVTVVGVLFYMLKAVVFSSCGPDHFREIVLSWYAQVPIIAPMFMITFVVCLVDL